MTGGLAGVAAAQAELERWVAENELPARAGYRLQLAFEELATNAVKYGGEGPPAAVRATVERHPDRVELELRDDGRPFDPTAVAPVELPASLDEARIGGLGLELVRKSASEFTYLRDGGENVTRVVLEWRP